MRTGVVSADAVARYVIVSSASTVYVWISFVLESATYSAGGDADAAAGSARRRISAGSLRMGCVAGANAHGCQRGRVCDILSNTAFCAAIEALIWSALAWAAFCAAAFCAACALLCVD